MHFCAAQHSPVAVRYFRMRYLFLFLALSVFSGCYSFKGFSINPELQHFDVEDFQNAAFNAPPTIAQTFTESLKLKVSRESRLEYNPDDPDISFSGTVTAFDVTSVSPERQGNVSVSALNRLEIRVSIQYTNERDSEEDWSQSFSHFEDFASNMNLLDVQDELIDLIFDQIIEDIFNKAFTNW